MRKIKTIQQVIETAREHHKQQGQIVLTGGCFDILHQGHLTFLQQAKAQGDVLVLLLESDQTIKKRKGDNRPVNSQEQRAKQLAALPFVDLIVCLPQLTTDAEYDDLVLSIKPAIIATTAGDPYRHHKERQAKSIGAQVRDVTDRLPEYSTTRLICNGTQ